MTTTTRKPKRGPVASVLRVCWIALCMLAGAGLAAGAAWLWLGGAVVVIASTVPGLAAGYLFGRFVPVSEVLFPTSSLFE